MQAFLRHTGTGAPLKRSNVDTDQILPSKFLKRVTRSGFEDALFAAWRSDPDFVLNKPAYSSASVLVAGVDFGTGSSREGAVWAMLNYGFRAVIAPRFGDIFRNNAGKAGLLAVQLDETLVVHLWELLEEHPEQLITVDLENLVVSAGEEFHTAFEFDSYTRWRLMNGLDDVAISLRSAERITQFEHARPVHKPVVLTPSRAAADDGIMAPALETTASGGVISAVTPKTPRSIVEKIWERQAIVRGDDLPDLLYIDMHFIHEVSSPQAFDGLREAGRTVRRPDLTLATEDHNVPTDTLLLRESTSRLQVETLRRNCEEFSLTLKPIGDPGQGIVHIIGPETGITQPGMTIVCGDSHTSTHGALGALAFGIGTSEVEHVLATQTLPQPKPKTMAVTVSGLLAPGVSSKDLALALIAKVGTGGGQGHIVEYRGEAIRALSIEARMSLCNLTIEWGARAGLVAPDETTFAYIKGRPFAPSGDNWEAAVEYWSSLRSDEGAQFDSIIEIDGSSIAPFVTWGTNPGQGVQLNGFVPSPDDFTDPDTRSAAERALAYMGLEPGTLMRDIPVDTVFIGSCTNSRIEDLRIAADILQDRLIAPNIKLLVVPGSMAVKLQAEKEHLDEAFLAAGGEWRAAGCSMCLGMNPDGASPGERTASTSNRNFEGRQGPGARTHLVSPAVAAATAVVGRLASPSDLFP